jgi:plasmid replication initiation protein
MIEELKGILKLQGKYGTYKDFRRRVLDLAVKEINASPLSEVKIDYQEIKTARAVTAVKFNIRINTQTPQLPGLPSTQNE